MHIIPYMSQVRSLLGWGGCGSACYHATAKGLAQPGPDGAAACLWEVLMALVLPAACSYPAEKTPQCCGLSGIICMLCKLKAQIHCKGGP